MMTEQRKLTRDEIIDRVLVRDGDLCYHPNCHKPFKQIDGKIDREDVTIDHWMPQAHGGTWALENLRLMHKPCNASKGDMIPLSATELPEKIRGANHAQRRATKSARVEVCERCQSGRSLGPGELCDVCGSGPMPERYPRWAKVPVKDCDHDDFWCWMCSIGLIERAPVDIGRIIMGPE